MLALARVLFIIAIGVAISYVFYRTIRLEEVRDNIITMNAMVIYTKGTPREMVWRKKLVQYIKQNQKYVDFEDVIWRDDLRKENLL